MTDRAPDGLPGTFITLEGVDGSGKSTQAARIADALRAEGRRVELTREPGGSPIAERIREILLDPDHGEMAWATEVMLYLASRAEHMAQRVLPALRAGAVVVCDRFLDSTLAYQAWGRAHGAEPKEAAAVIREANRLGTGGVGPELTFLFDLDPLVGLQRARGAGRGPDRLEGGGLAFLRRVRAGFLELAASEPDRIVVVDAARPEDVISEEILSLTRALLGRKEEV